MNATMRCNISGILKWAILMGFVFQFTLSAQAQDSVYVKLDKQRRKINLNGMLVSGAWSLANAGWSSYSLFQKNDLKTKSFHEMNLGWSAINLVIFGLGARENYSKKNYPTNISEALKAHAKNRKIFKINAFLDIFYIATGAGMMVLSNSENKESNQKLQGFGTSVLTQGIYLLGFDSFMYFKLKKRDRLYDFQ